MLWVGSTGWGLYNYFLSQNECADAVHGIFPYAQNSLSSNNIQAIIKDDSGKIWIATNGSGLNTIKEKSIWPVFFHFKNEPSNPRSLSSDNLSDMCLDKNGVFWITTYSGVLNRFDPHAKDGKYFIRITGTDDLSGQGMFSMLSDLKNNLWITTASATLKYNIAENKFTSYKLKEQLPFDQYPGKKYIGRDGTIYIGRDKFYLSFHPDSLRDNPDTPRLQ